MFHNLFIMNNLDNREKLKLVMSGKTGLVRLAVKGLSIS